jgi:hypothetical protein
MAANLLPMLLLAGIVSGRLFASPAGATSRRTAPGRAARCLCRSGSRALWVFVAVRYSSPALKEQRIAAHLYRGVYLDTPNAG